MKSMDRRTGGFQMLQMDDMADSSAPSQASEIVIGIFHPSREKMAKIDGYNVKILKDRIRVVQILKNRFGESDINICVDFNGAIGYFTELPSSDDINYNEYTVEDINENKDTNENVDEQKNIIYTF